MGHETIVHQSFVFFLMGTLPQFSASNPLVFGYCIGEYNQTLSEHDGIWDPQSSLSTCSQFEKGSSRNIVLLCFHMVNMMCGEIMVDVISSFLMLSESTALSS